MRYVFIAFFGVLLLVHCERLTPAQLLVGGGFLLYSLVTVGLILERRPGATWREMLRIALFVVAIGLMPDPDIPGWPLMELSIHAVSLFSLGCVVAYRWVLSPRWQAAAAARRADGGSASAV